MKFRNLLAVAVLGATSVAFAQLTPGGSATTTWNNPCTGSYADANPCSVTGYTKLVAIYPEGLTLTLPNQINFVLTKGMQNPGSEPLIAQVEWTLGGDRGDGTAYSQLFVDAYFQTSDALLASDTDSMGGNIPYNAVLGSLNGLGAITPFGVALNPTDPLSDVYSGAETMAFPMLHQTLVTGADGNETGTASPSLNLYIDFTSASPIYNTIQPGGVGTWAGYVYVSAMAF